MKTLVIIFTLSSVAWARDCDKDFMAQTGVCADMSIKPESVTPAESAKWVSDEQPPRNKMPSWQREGTKVADDSKMGRGADDIKADQERTSAEAEGMAACEKKFGKGQCGERGKEPK